MTSINHNLDPHKERRKGRYLIIDYIRRTVEAGTGLTIPELKEEYAEEGFFNEALRHVTTTKKALCAALDTPVETACRYKRTAQKADKLWEVDHIYCPFTKHLAWSLTTNPDNRPKDDDGPKSVQLSLF